MLHYEVNPLTLVDFTNKPTTAGWKVVDDVVMGGKSSGNFNISEDGYGVFDGYVSLENNGGFSSLRYLFQTLDISNSTTVKLKVKGDGSRFQFRVKSQSRDYYSYITYFKTTGNWQEVSLNLDQFYPSFRGRRLNGPNFSSDNIEEIAFLIGNKKEQDFELKIASIVFE